MSEDYDQSAAYNERIMPLMKQVFDLCILHDIPMLAYFNTTHIGGKNRFTQVRVVDTPRRPLLFESIQRLVVSVETLPSAVASVPAPPATAPVGPATSTILWEGEL